MQEITHSAHHGATQRAVWLACGRVANVIGARSLVHRREGEESEAVLKVGVRHWQGSVRRECEGEQCGDRLGARVEE